MRTSSRGCRGGARKSGMILPLVLLTLAVTCHGCPDRCLCSSQTVKCQNQELDAIPSPLPGNTKILFVTGNNITHLGANSFPAGLDMLTDLYLTGNGIELVDDDTFHNLPSLSSLDLSNNNLQTFGEGAFPDENKLQVLNLSKSFHNSSDMDAVLSVLQSGNLLALKVLDLSNNDLVMLPDDAFRSLPSLTNVSLQNNSVVTVHNGTLKVPPLRDLDLRDNSLRVLQTTTLEEFSLKPGLRLWLGGNPWHCDCYLEEMLLWLRNSTQVADAQELTCDDPKALRRRPLLQVDTSRLKCPGDMEGVLETSYVFLGLVLALIGVIFLLVLYLNRKGIKRWLYNIRDACRDHMEGYHYRYEINSDPRLANLSINSDV